MMHQPYYLITSCFNADKVISPSVFQILPLKNKLKRIIATKTPKHQITPKEEY